MGKFKIINAFRLNYNYAAAAYIEKSYLHIKKQQFKSLLFVLLNPYFTLKWQKLLIDNVELKNAFQNRKLLYAKPYKCYVSSKWNIEKRLKVILDTYSFLEENKVLKETLMSKKQLISIQLKSNTKANIVFNYENKFRNEGELVLSIEIPDHNKRYYSIVFSFEKLKSEYWIIRIGCIQGSNTVKNEDIKFLHKELFGMRPKAFLMYVIQQLAIKLEIKEILATSNRIQAHNKKHLIHIPWKHKINNDYDAFFYELKATKVEDGWFKIPFTYNIKNIQDIPSHKRAIYKKRYNMMNEIAVKMANTNFN